MCRENVLTQTTAIQIAVVFLSIKKNLVHLPILKNSAYRYGRKRNKKQPAWGHNGQEP